MKYKEIHKAKVKNVQIRVIRVIKSIIFIFLLISELHAQERIFLSENSFSKKGGNEYIYFELKSNNSKLPKPYGVTIFFADGNRKYFLTMIFHKLKYNNSKASVLKVGNNSITTIDSLIKKIKFVGIHNANYLLSIIVPIQRRGESWVQVSNMSKMVYSSICNHELTENLVDRTITFNFCDNRIIYNKDFFKQIPLEIYAEKTMGHVFQLKKSNHYSLFEITSFTFSSYSPEPKNTYYYPFISNMNEKYMVNFYLGIVGFYGMNGFGNEIRFLAKKINNKNGKRYLSFGEKEIFQ